MEGKIQENADAKEQMTTQEGRQEKDLGPVVAILFMHPVPPPPSFCERLLSSFSV